MPGPDILYLSHCVPGPPDKGEKIRSYHELTHLSGRYRVHLVCFTRHPSEIEYVDQLRGQCASVYAEPLPFARALARAGLRFAAGGCLNMHFYSAGRMRRHVRDLARRVPIAATLAGSVVMAQYAPEGAPCVLDMQDVDSEKWFQYSQTRRPGFLFAWEARRLRKMEADYASRAVRTLFTTESEENLFKGFAPEAATGFMENGVDFEHFDPARSPEIAELSDRRYVVFVGTMDYYPNVEAVCWFANSVLPVLRRVDPALEFLIVGRNPAKAVLDLKGAEGVRVTGAVEDVRPYLKSALAMVAPLRIARGIQNKVLEALAMGKVVLASGAVLKTFGARVPAGVLRCDSEKEYADALAGSASGSAAEIRECAKRRFSWATNLGVLLGEMEAATRQ